MGGQYGVKATEAAMDLLFVVSLAIVAEAQKTGWRWSDLPAFLKSPKLEEALKPVVATASHVPTEVGELDLWDDLELGRHVYGKIQELVAELKKVPKVTVT